MSQFQCLIKFSQASCCGCHSETLPVGDHWGAYLHHNKWITRTLTLTLMLSLFSQPKKHLPPDLAVDKACHLASWHYYSVTIHAGMYTRSAAHTVSHTPQEHTCFLNLDYDIQVFSQFVQKYCIHTYTMCSWRLAPTQTAPYWSGPPHSLGTPPKLQPKKQLQCELVHGLMSISMLLCADVHDISSVRAAMHIVSAVWLNLAAVVKWLGALTHVW
jgi:hypothetical protein